MKNVQKHAIKSSPNKRHLVIIIVVAVISALIIAGAIVFALLWFSHNEKPVDPTQSTAVTVSPTTAAATQKPSVSVTIETKAQTQAATEKTDDDVEMDEDRGAPGKSGLHASGEGERVIAPEPW